MSKIFNYLLFSQGAIYETDEIHNNFYVIKASFISCTSSQGGFANILRAKIDGGGIVPFGGTFRIYLQAAHCLSSPDFANPKMSAERIYAKFFQNKTYSSLEETNPTSGFAVESVAIKNNQILTSKITTSNGKWLNRVDHCWPSDEINLDSCSRDSSKIFLAVPRNAAMCNRYWNLNLSMITTYSDLPSYSSLFLIENILITCLPEKIGIFHPTLLRSPATHLPGKSSSISFKMSVIESSPKLLTFVETFEDYSVLVRYGDCRNVVAEDYVTNPPAHVATCQLQATGGVRFKGKKALF